MRKDFIEAYKKFVEVWGEESQFLMAVEEMSELIKELCKHKRLDAKYSPNATAKEKEENLNRIREEIADVLNMTEQLEFIFGKDEVERIRKEKIDRTLKIINEIK